MKNLVRILAVSTAAFSLSASAEELDDFIANLDEMVKETEEADAALTKIADKGENAGSKDASKPFYLLPCCRTVDGTVEVLTPGSSKWEAVKEGNYYPLGSKYRTVGAASRLILAFGYYSEVHMEGNSSFGTLMMPFGDKKRGITLDSGTISIKMPNNLPEGLFTVNAPGFVAYNPAGESKYTYTKTVDGDEVLVRCVTKTLSIKGRNFDIASMRAANELKIRTSNDFLVTSLHGVGGDILVKLDQGCFSYRDLGTGEMKIEEKTLDWKLSPRTVVRIYRGKNNLGPNLSVTVITFDASGDLKNRCAFTEHCKEVNSGELGPTSKKDREALAKRAADMTGTEEVEAVTTEEAVSGASAETTTTTTPQTESSDDLGL